LPLSANLYILHHPRETAPNGKIFLISEKVKRFIMMSTIWYNAVMNKLISTKVCSKIIMVVVNMWWTKFVPEDGPTVAEIYL
jgi:hypothetical protein